MRSGGGLGVLQRPLLSSLLALLAVGLLTAIVLQGAAALQQDERSANALISEAQILVGAPTPKSLARAKGLASEVMQATPLDSRAASLMGTIREIEKDDKGAFAFMSVAAQLSRRDNLTDLWLFNHMLRTKDYDGAFTHLDAFLRRDVIGSDAKLRPYVYEALADPKALAPLAKRLAKNPGWRVRLTDEFTRISADPGAAFVILSAIKDAGGEVSMAEIQALVKRLVAAKEFERAYLDWIVLLPPDLIDRIRPIYDGDFNDWPAAPPLGWEFGSNVTGGIEPAADGREGYALRIGFANLPPRPLPRQLLLLPPGAYSFTGEAMADTPESAARLSWVVRCDGAETPLAVAHTPGGNGRWTRFSVSLRIPEGAACKAQWLELVAGPPASRGNIETWYDKLAINPIEGAGA